MKVTVFFIYLLISRIPSKHQSYDGFSLLLGTEK